MREPPLTVDHLDYLQRTRIVPPADVPPAPGPAVTRLDRVAGVGVVRQAPDGRSDPGGPLPTEDLLNGLFACRVGVAFLLGRAPGAAGVEVCFGTWANAPARRGAADGGDDRQQLVRAALESLYPRVDFAPATLRPGAFADAGFVLGTPDPAANRPVKGGLPVDRLIRAMGNDAWAALVLAEPVEEELTSRLRGQVIDEARRAQAAAQAERAESPLARHYVELLAALLGNLTVALGTGLWRTGAYLLGEGVSYHKLATLWRGLYSGEKSLPEAVRVWKAPGAADLAARWALPATPCPRGPEPGYFAHPLLYQTLLTSAQLAACVHLPSQETSGFTVHALSSFDVEPPAAAARVVSLGRVKQHHRTLTREYRVELDSLTRHALVAGTTGAGKTTTIFHLLRQADARGVPFLVIEPAKREYRALRRDPRLAERLRVVRLGDESSSRFRLNPFEVAQDAMVGTHLDLLRAVFNASFGMWSPLPEVLEQCLYEVYRDHGWDLTWGANDRLGPGSDRSRAFPTLTDLWRKVDEVVPRLGYDKKVADDIRGALRTRLNSLRVGGKGRMLDTRDADPSVPAVEELFRSPAVLELEAVGSDDDKAFLMGLLLIRLIEHRRQAGAREGLEHLLVIEEGHRLLGRPRPSSPELLGDPRARAVETFAQLLAEIRAYGQGVVISDQSPVRLIPDAIKNTDLKVAHQVVALEDRAALGGAMAMDEAQHAGLTTLRPGEALVFGAGADAPVLVQVHNGRGGFPEDEADVEEAQPAEDGRAAGDGDAVRDAVRDLVDDAVFQRDFVRLVVSVTADAGALGRLWDAFIVRERARRPAAVGGATFRARLLASASEWLARRRGRQAGWTYAETGEYGDLLREMLLAKEGAGRAGGNGDGAGPPSPAVEEAVRRFRERAEQLHRREALPYPGCEHICPEQTDGGARRCFYRHAVADLVGRSKAALKQQWEDSYRQDAASGKDGLPLTLRHARNFAVDHLVENDAAQQETIRRVALCYCQHVLNERFPDVHGEVLAGLLRAYPGARGG
jgi:hypothetical protein